MSHPDDADGLACYLVWPRPFVPPDGTVPIPRSGRLELQDELAYDTDHQPDRVLGNGWGVASIVVRDLDTHLIQGSHVYRIVARAGRLHQLEARTQPSELDIEAAVRHERRDSVLHHLRLRIELAVAVDPLHLDSLGRERPHSL